MDDEQQDHHHQQQQEQQFEGDDEEIPVISDNETLLRYGICRVPLPVQLEVAKWATELSQVTPKILLGQGDGEYAFYRNIMDEPEFPFDLILDANFEIGRAILKHFPISSFDELRLDNSFCVHYNADQEDTTGAKHMDPSDITVNLCLEKTNDTVGSHVLFFGTILDANFEIGRAILKHFPISSFDELRLDNSFCVHYNADQEDTTGAKHMDPSDITVNLCLEKTNDTVGSHVLFFGTKQLFLEVEHDEEFRHKYEDAHTMIRSQHHFYGCQKPGTATIHLGNHLHETIALKRGKRTNIVLTYCYKDPKRSGAQMRSC